MHVSYFIGCSSLYNFARFLNDFFDYDGKDLTYCVELLLNDTFLLNMLAFFPGLAIDFAIAVRERHISRDQILN
jgi:hypothetical protein